MLSKRKQLRIVAYRTAIELLRMNIDTLVRKNNSIVISQECSPKIMVIVLENMFKIVTKDNSGKEIKTEVRPDFLLGTIQRLLKEEIPDL